MGTIAHLMVLNLDTIETAKDESHDGIHQLLMRSSQKLATRFYGPFQVVAKIRTFVYKLQLPPSTEIHLVFYISLLKKNIGDNATTLPPYSSAGTME